MTDTVHTGKPVTLLVTLAIVGSALGGALYMMRRADARMQQTANADEVHNIPVEIVTLQRTDVPRVIETRGFLSGIHEVVVHAEVSGKVISRPVEEGALVNEGDVLLTIDDTNYRLAVDRFNAEQIRARALLREANSGIAQAEAQLAAAKAVQSNRQEEFERIDWLFKEGSSPPVEHDRVLTAKRTADADYAAAEAAVERVIGQRATAEAAVAIAMAAMAEAQEQLSRCTVRADMPGRVHHYYVEVGGLAVASAPMLELVRLDEMKMNVAIDDRDIPLLRNFESAEVFADAAPNQTHRASLHHMAPKLDPMSKKFQVELRVDNSDSSLLSGMYGHAVLKCGSLENRLVVPRESVFRHFGARHCLIVSDTDAGQKAQLRRVKVKEITGMLDALEITDGLAEGEQVITTRRRELHDGVPINVVNDPAAAVAAAPTSELQ